MTALDQLLELQRHDTALDQLDHRQRTLPERTRLGEIDARRRALVDGVADVRAERERLAREQRRLEDEVAGVEEKAATVDRQLYGGGITSPKEAQALQADIESLKRRQATLEDEVLGLMEQAEPLDAQLAANDDAVAALDAERAAAEEALTAVEAELADAVATQRAARDDAAAAVPPELLATYEDLRPRLEGVAVARLQGATCQGCHLTLSAAEVDRIRHEPPDAVVRCPECTRLLVR